MKKDMEAVRQALAEMTDGEFAAYIAKLARLRASALKETGKPRNSGMWQSFNRWN